MGFMSHRQKNVEIRPEQKWDYISLNDFKSTSCLTPFAYGYLHFSLLLSTAVYSIDTFTAVNLLAFNKWSSEISLTSYISFTASKWIFSICIILSFVNLAYEHIRAQRIMKRGSVVECYLDSLAARLECIRWGKGQGWKRFLVFAELTKSKKGAEYVALFTYFSFQAWLRVLICSGPRQVVNALTLVSFYNAKLSASGDNIGNTLLDFLDKIKALAVDNYQQALVLSGMIFTVIVWLFSFLSLLLAFAFYIFFLVCYIPRSDGGLSGFCYRKINKRLMKIVMVKMNTAMAEEERRRKKAELKAAKKAGELPLPEQKATLPNLGNDKLPQMPMLNRNDTMATLPAYSSRPGTAGSFEMGDLDQKRPGGGMPARSGMMASSSAGNNYSAHAPLLGYAAEPGRANFSASPAPTLPTLPTLPVMGGMLPAPQRTGTAMSMSQRTGTAMSTRNIGADSRQPTIPELGSGGFLPPIRTGTAMSNMSNMSSMSNMASRNMGASRRQPSIPELDSGITLPPTALANRTASPAPTIPTLPELDDGGGTFTIPQRPGTAQSNRSFAGAQPTPMRNLTGGPTPLRNGSTSSRGDGYTASPVMYSSETMPSLPEPARSPAGYPNQPQYGANQSMHSASASNGSMSSARFVPYSGENGRASPAPSARSFGPNGNNYPGSPRGMPSPMRSATNPMPGRGSPAPASGFGYGQQPYSPQPQRNMTAPLMQMGHERQHSNESFSSSYYSQAPAPSRQGNGPSRLGYENNSWNADVESQRGPGRY